MPNSVRAFTLSAKESSLKEIIVLLALQISTLTVEVLKYIDLPFPFYYVCPKANLWTGISVAAWWPSISNYIKFKFSSPQLNISDLVDMAELQNHSFMPQ